jgi:membrane protein DedA with SNARE-associated domain
MNILVSAHSGLRWIALVLLLLAIYNAFTAKEYEKKHRLVNMFAMISLHTQLLIGLALYFTSDKVQFIEGWMKSPLLRFYGMEHFAGMLIAIVLVTIGHSKSKKATESSDKFKAIKLWYVLALILILAFIPWPFRTVLGAGWF